MSVFLKIEIKNCKGCPNKESERYYTGDSFDTCFIWKCKAKKNKEIGIFDWHEEPKMNFIPKWCPLKKSEKVKRQEYFW